MSYSALRVKFYTSVIVVGPPEKNLVRYAASEMNPHPSDDHCWILSYSDGSKQIFVDTLNSVESINCWLRDDVLPWFQMPALAEGGWLLESTIEDGWYRGPSPLLVTGPLRVSNTHEYPF